MRVRLLGLLAAAASLALGLMSPAAAQPRERTVTFLAVNDIYRLEGVSEGKSGGLTRLRTLRSWIERDAPNAIVLHAGDFLSPSLESKVFKGEQMIDVMNGLDGKPDAFDERMFVTFGNHEFDESRCDRTDPPLNARVAHSQFTWLGNNLDFPNCPGMQAMFGNKNVSKDGVVIEVSGIKVGLFGIGQTPDQVGLPRFPANLKSADVARAAIASLKGRGAELVVAVTHLSRAEDEALLKEFSAQGLDLIAGGHDHENMVMLDPQGQPRGFKADSDARSAWRIDVQVPAGGKPRIEAQLIILNEAIPPDAALVALSEKWLARAGEKICAARGMASPTCLEEKIGKTQLPIALEEIENRTTETGFGDWLADLMAAKTGAQVAIINSGILGLNEDLAAGTVLKLKHIVDTFRFDDVVAVRSIPAKQVCAAINHGFQTPGMGRWPHTSGMDIVVKRTQGAYEGATVTRFRKIKGLNCNSSRPVKVASIPFILCSGDGYNLLPGGDACIKELQAKPLPSGGPKMLLSKAAEQAIRDAKNGIEPKKDGRVKFVTK